ncbi:MAG TPA: peptidase E [Actinomycetes bacterium]|nr:peptidase E [Actinomycetes bacterium]
MSTPRILATSGGFIASNRWAVMEPGGIMREFLRLTGKDRPRLTFVMTASGDDRSYLTRSYSAFRGWSVELSHLELFSQPNTDPRELLLSSDAIWVGGGSVANLLAVWRVHQLDEILAEAWNSGIILGGVSAGSICWHVGGTTDSFGPTLEPVNNGLALLPYGNGVHYDSEEQRRPLLHQIVKAGGLPLSYATDDGIGILYEGTDAASVWADRPETEAAAYRVEKVWNDVVETRLPPGPIRA